MKLFAAILVVSSGSQSVQLQESGYIQGKKSLPSTSLELYLDSSRTFVCRGLKQS
jgi:hypothetical protein